MEHLAESHFYRNHITMALTFYVDQKDFESIVQNLSQYAQNQPFDPVYTLPENTAVRRPTAGGQLPSAGGQLPEATAARRPSAGGQLPKEVVEEAVIGALHCARKNHSVSWMGIWFVWKRYADRFPRVATFREFISRMETLRRRDETLPMPKEYYAFYQNDPYLTDRRVPIGKWTGAEWQKVLREEDVGLDHSTKKYSWSHLPYIRETAEELERRLGLAEP